MTEQLSDTRNAQVYNGDLNNQPSIVQLRLDVREILYNIENFLRGKIVTTSLDNDGNIQQENKSLGEPKANEQGIQNIMLRVGAIFNTAVVQSNFDEEGLSVYLMNLEISLARMVMVNCYKWNIKNEEQDILIDFMMDMVEPFMRRTIDNQERIMLGASTKIVERSGNNEDPNKKSGWFNLVK